MAIHSQYVTGRKVEIRIHPQVYKDANLFGLYNLCTSAPHEMDPVSLTSAYVLTVLVADIQAFLYAGAYAFYKVVNYEPVAVLTSAYSLSTEAP